MSKQPEKSGAEDPKGLPAADAESAVEQDGARTDGAPREVGGRDGPDPTRYGDWEKAGRCIDF